MLAVETRLDDDALPIVAPESFILATRDTGYRSLSEAVAELIDNSLQAEATVIDISVIEDRRVVDRPLSVAVLDNGVGMNPAQLHTALQFGGSNRFGDRGGPGRFGMGLPNSSVSQTRFLEVYSWTEGEAPFHTFLDVDGIASGVVRGIPLPRQKELPSWCPSTDPRTHGTLVLWANCDRLDRRKASTVAQKLRYSLGRMYRRALWGGLSLSINRRSVEPFDPLFCDPTSQTGGAMQFGEALVYGVEGTSGFGQSSLVTVRFTELPVERWHSLSVNEKRSRGIIGGAGTSVLRAGREIDTGWYFMGGKRRENYDDWWRCEVSFEPPLDELFGVTHSKQGISPTPTLRAILSDDIEAVARQLNARVRQEFERVRGGSPTLAARAATLGDPYLPPLVSFGRPGIEPWVQGGQGQEESIQYAVSTRALPVEDFFVLDRAKDKVCLVLNSNHPFFERIYGPLQSRADEGQDWVECILLSAVRASLAAPLDHESWIQFCHEWSNALAVFLDGVK